MTDVPGSNGPNPQGERAAGDEPRERQLRALPTSPAPAGSAPPATVRLVREFKGLTVAGVLRTAEESPNLLPGRLVAVLDQLAEGDLAGADRQLDLTLRRILPGPGSQRRRRRMAALLWPLLAALAVGAALAAALFFTASGGVGW